ncbi:MAG: cell division protein ZapA [Nitrospinota bacterium]
MAKIDIYGKTYNLKSSSGEISVEDAAAYVDAKMRELSEARKKTPSMDLAVLAALNIAQELLELQKKTLAEGEAREEKVGQLVAALEKELQGIEK